LRGAAGIGQRKDMGGVVNSLKKIKEKYIIDVEFTRSSKGHFEKKLKVHF
jgi:hypothetical protein